MVSALQATAVKRAVGSAEQPEPASTSVLDGQPFEELVADHGTQADVNARGGGRWRPHRERNLSNDPAQGRRVHPCDPPRKPAPLGSVRPTARLFESQA